MENTQALRVINSVCGNVRGNVRGADKNGRKYREDEIDLRPLRKRKRKGGKGNKFKKLKAHVD